MLTARRSRGEAWGALMDPWAHKWINTKHLSSSGLSEAYCTSHSSENEDSPSMATTRPGSVLKCEFISSQQHWPLCVSSHRDLGSCMPWANLAFPGRGRGCLTPLQGSGLALELPRSQSLSSTSRAVSALDRGWDEAQEGELHRTFPARSAGVSAPGQDR